MGICLRVISFGAFMDPGTMLLIALCVLAIAAFLEDFFRD